MNVHAPSFPASEDALTDPRLRLFLLTRLAGTTFSAIEIEGRIRRGSLSEYGKGGRSYPKMRRAIVGHLAEHLGREADEVAEYLFPDNGPAP